MLYPKHVADICQTLIQAVNIPVTVKCRLGVDDNDKWSDVVDFIQTVSEEGGVRKFIVHARKAVLGMTSKQNRKIPPLQHDWVIRLKETFPHLDIVINGGIKEASEVQDILEKPTGLMGAMVGRMAMHTPWEIAKVEKLVYKRDTGTRKELILDFAKYA